jgi:hypothetical protein
MKIEKQSSRIYLLIALFLVSLPSCASHSVETSTFPSVGLPESAMNEVIQIEELPQFGNSHKNNTFLYLHVKNLSQKTIAFSRVSAVTIFTKNGENWDSVINNMHYPSEIIYLTPTNKSPSGIVINTVPHISMMIESKTIRIIVIGYYENSESDLVGAYLDVTIKP